MRLARTVLQDLRSQKGRSALTVLSILVGVLSISAVALAGTAMQKTLVARAQQDSAVEFTYDARLAPTDGAADSIDQLWGLLRARTQGQAVWMSASAETSLTRAEDRDLRYAVVVYRGDYLAQRSLPLVDGRFPATGRTYPVEVLANAGAALGPGTVVTLRSESGRVSTATVTGVLGNGSDPTPRLYADSGRAAVLDPAMSTPDAVTLWVTPRTACKPCAAALLGAVSGRGWSTTEVDRYDQVQGVRDQLAMLGTLFTWVAVVALLVATIGILNVGLAGIAQRSRELSIRRAVGARRGDLVAHVVAVAVAQAMIACVLGVGLTWALGQWVLPRVLPDNLAVESVTPNAVTVLVSVAAATVTAVLGSAVPAIRAARVEIAGVLRA